MVLIKWLTESKNLKSKEFTFQYGSNQIEQIYAWGDGMIRFTFQYGSNQILYASNQAL